MDFRLKTLLYPKTYFRIDVLLIKETQKAILIEFDGKEIWLPKAWIVKINRKRHCKKQSDEIIYIKISEYHWVAAIYPSI